QGSGLIAALLYAVSPALMVFSNMLVAHMPTLLGLMLFLVAILRCCQRPTAGFALLAGTGLAFAMICRPMTAAGFALPFGLHWIWRLLRPASSESDETHKTNRPTWAATVSLGLPLVIGMAGMLAYNHSITGRATVSPYQLYADIYTPRH